MSLCLIHHAEQTAVDGGPGVALLVIQHPVADLTDDDHTFLRLVTVQIPRALEAHVGYALPAEVLHQGLLRLEHERLRLRVPEPHHQHRLAVQLEQHRHVAVAVAVPVGEVDALKLLPRVALQRHGVVHIVVYGIRLIVIAENSIVIVGAHQHIYVSAIPGDRALGPHHAGNAPVVAYHIVGVFILITAAGGQAQAQRQRRHQRK